jgi:hypothetical protein
MSLGMAGIVKEAFDGVQDVTGVDLDGLFDQTFARPLRSRNRLCVGLAPRFAYLMCLSIQEGHAALKRSQGPDRITR